MTVRSRVVAILTAFTLAWVSYAAAQAPQGATAECKDGTYSSTASKRGACAGHKGVKTWLAGEGASSAPVAPAPATSTAPAATSKAQATPPATARSDTKPASAAGAGGANGQVWVNISSNVYHCTGDRWYGKTKAGQYMSEADAKAKGARPARGKACS